MSDGRVGGTEDSGGSAGKTLLCPRPPPEIEGFRAILTLFASSGPRFQRSNPAMSLSASQSAPTSPRE